jgi:hypothetical protein
VANHKTCLPAKDDRGQNSLTVIMTAVPIAVVVMIPIAIVIIVAMPVFPVAIVSATMFFNFTPGCCHQQTGQAE